jgi:hypothetical protein
MKTIIQTLTTLFVPKVRLGFLDKILGAVTSIPIVGDLLGVGAEHASAKNLQNDSQAHDSHMFGMQAEHDKTMFGMESEFASAQAAKQYERQRKMLQDSPRLQMEGLKSAGLNPILAASGGFKSPAGGSLPIPTARASSSAKGSGQTAPAGAKITVGQAKLLREQATATAKQGNLYDAQADKVKKETEYVGNKIDISEPIARAMEALVKVAERMAAKDEKGKSEAINRLEKMVKESKQDVQRLWDFLVNTYGNAQKAFEAIRNKGVIHLPNVRIE